MICEVEGKWPYHCCFVGVASRIYSKQHVTFLLCLHQAFSLHVSLESSRFIHTVVPKWAQLGRNPVLYYLGDQISIWLTAYKYAVHRWKWGYYRNQCHKTAVIIKIWIFITLTEMLPAAAFKLKSMKPYRI